MTKSADPSAIAIIGVACRFPGADDPSAFWTNLCRGVESITFFSDEELLAAGVDPSLLASPSYVKASPVLVDADKFDAAFFGYSPREAAIMDPQQRLFLEVAWEAFEDAGYHPESSGGTVGVFAGGGGVVTSYLAAHRLHPSFPGQTAGLAHLGNDKDFLSTRVSYKLNLTGPSVTVQTACSTSLVAVHLGCQSLLAGECDMVLTGAATVRVPQVSGYLVEKGNVHSLDGHCRAFDAAGQGTIFGSGVAAVLLKDLSNAVADGDHVYAVIKGTAVNNDGGMKISYTAPSVSGQARAMHDALAAAGVPPETIGYVECHATGTTIGDPLEIQALTRAFQTQMPRRRCCAVGSVKTNIGHPEQAAGLAGLIKTALALRHGRIPPSLHFVTPNPRIDFAQSPFYVNTTLDDWPAKGHPRRAAVNSLGIGGTNAFAVLEEAPPAPAPEPDTRPLHVFTLSAKTDVALVEYARRFCSFLEAASRIELADLCYTANMSRSHFRHRFAVTTDSVGALAAKVAACAAAGASAGTTRGNRERRPVAFLFTGQGSQYPRMAEELYRTQPTFRRLLDECDAGLRPHLDRPILDVLFARGSDGELVHETAYTQPALFAVEYALAQLWQTWGVAPGAVMGHSIGEIVAACVAGVFELGDALRLVAERGRLMQSLSRDGAMAVVFAAETLVRDALDAVTDRVAVAAVNGPLNTVISGARREVAEVLAVLRNRNIACETLTVSHAFHSALVDPVLDRLEEAARGITQREPTLTLISNLTGGPLAGPPEAGYWRDHARCPVRFADGIRTLHQLGYRLFLEVGPGSALLGMGRQCLPDSETAWLPSLSSRKHDWQVMLESLRALYLEGGTIDWSRVHEGAGRRRVSLPTYPFQRKRYWLDRITTSETDDATARGRGIHPLLGRSTGSDPTGIQFEVLYGRTQLPYLNDHRVHGQTVLPTAVGLEAALAAGRSHFGGAPVQVEDLSYHQALFLPDDGDKPVRLVLRSVEDGRVTFRMLSRDGDGTGEWRTHMSGVLSQVGETPPVDAEVPTVSLPEALRADCPREMPADAYYAAVKGLGLDYGPSFRGIQALWRGRAAAVARVRLAAGSSPGSPYTLHPAFLDACLHVYLAALGGLGTGDPEAGRHEDTYLPVGVERFRVYRGQVTEGWTHAVVREQAAPGQTVVIDIRVYDTDGRRVAALDGLAVRRLPRASLTVPADAAVGDWLYRPRWRERRFTTPPRAALASWLIFADRGGVGAALAAVLEGRGDWCQLVFADSTDAASDPTCPTVDPTRLEDFRRVVGEESAATGLPCRGVVYLWGLDVPSLANMTVEGLERADALGTGGALLLTQALAGARLADTFAPRLWLVTRHAQSVDPVARQPVEVAQAPLWGLGRTIALEYPQMWGGLIDLPPAGQSTPQEDAVALAAELGQTDGEGEVALRNGQRLVCRLERLPRDATQAPGPQFRADARYLITGGLGMMGLRIARWLVERHGVRFLVLVGRRDAQARAQGAVEALRGRGATVDVVRADVSVQADLERLLDGIRSQSPPLKGVIHCAGVVDDGVLDQMDRGKFVRATDPKIKGSWLLHHLTRDMELDFFVLHSSLLSLTGSAGQANYTAGNAFVDALGAYRRGQGLPATVVNWGPWADAGMAAVSGARGAAIWRARGTRHLPPDDGIRALEHLLGRGVGHAAVTITDWTTYLAQFPEPPPLYAELARAVGAAGRPKGPGDDANVQARLREAPAGEQRTLLVGLIRGQIMDELAFDEPIDAGQPLNELGLDSLMSVNVANRLERALGIAVPIAKLIRGPSLAELVDDLFPHLANADPSGTAAADAPQTVVAAPRAGLSNGGTSTTTDRGWLIRPRPNPGARSRLFCFHYAGGGAATFRPWGDALDPTIELVAIEPPGRGARADEPLVERMDAFVEELLPAMTPYLDKPFALFGHCLGALTLFETARRLLADEARPLERIFVSGARPPHLVARQGPFEEEMLAQLLQHPGFDPFRPGHEQPDDVFADMLRRFDIGATDEFLNSPELRRLLLPLVRADFAMAFHYRFTPAPPWNAPVTCFLGLGDPYVTREEALEWGRYTETEFRLVLRPTAHFLIVDDRRVIVDTINRELGRRPTPTQGERDG
jgi:acyl transferase domain-containing protein/surfactin synthase thioesterase subunit/acyl carrier protein